MCICTLKSLIIRPFSIPMCLSTPIKPSSTQMYFCTPFNSIISLHPQPLISYLSRLKCAFAPSNHSNQAFLNSNMVFQPQITQMRPSPSQICLSNHVPLKPGLSQLKCALAPSSHSNEILFNTNTLSQSSNHSIHMCFHTLKSLKSIIFQLKYP